MRIRRALISVSDKGGLEELAQGLVDLGVTIVSTGGTARALARAGIPVTPASEVTQAPEMLEGRVKTLHPRIHAAILADRRKPQHLAQLKAHNISPIDLVVCNLYPFAETVARKGVTEEEAIEQIDVGGPTMLRGAAKNHRSVGVVVNPARYGEVLTEMRSRSASLSEATRVRLAWEAFAHTAAYDIAIARWLDPEEGLPTTMLLAAEQHLSLRYGENPHQAAAFYASADPGWQQLAGKELSYNNLADLDAAWRLVREFPYPAVAIIKHTNPCGCATGAGVEEAYRRALESDPRSAFGGIVAANREIKGSTARRIIEIMTEVVVAPSFAGDALSILGQRKNLRVIEVRGFPAQLELRSAAGGLLMQGADIAAEGRESMRVAGAFEPTSADWDDLLFAWRVVSHVSSNGAVLATGAQTVGIGAGLTSRVEAVEMAARRAGDRAKGAVLASDGFFPFRDGLDSAAEAGVRAVIQPGGSVRDPEVIAAADEHRLPMVFAGRRHFRH
ncbi:MAG: bifunctional phosphoribosylaminoimidazolecarboxamide formyltransferase/IMP cyclohydrolase [Actinomycetota bacterium]